MVGNGVFITLSDEASLRLYLANGLYGMLVKPELEGIESRSRHYHILADYACCRRGTHVFFFLKRKIVYGGEIEGPSEYAAFLLNGKNSPLCVEANSPLVWDESRRTIYSRTRKRGVFNVNEFGEKCQPYLIKYSDKLGLKGYSISPDDLYWELGKYPYPLPSNTITDMGFCTLTPGETQTALDLIGAKAGVYFEPVTKENILISGKPVPFTPRCVFNHIGRAFKGNSFANEAHVEFTVIASPRLLPPDLRPPKGAAICRQVPFSPFKPANYIDRADVCYYSPDAIKNGTVPNTLIELKKTTVNKDHVIQANRYLDWLYRITDSQDARRVKVFVFGPSVTRTAERFIKPEYENQLRIVIPS